MTHLRPSALQEIISSVWGSDTISYLRRSRLMGEADRSMLKLGEGASDERRRRPLPCQSFAEPTRTAGTVFGAHGAIARQGQADLRFGQEGWHRLGGWCCFLMLPGRGSLCCATSCSCVRHAALCCSMSCKHAARGQGPSPDDTQPGSRCLQALDPQEKGKWHEAPKTRVEYESTQERACRPSALLHFSPLPL